MDRIRHRGVLGMLLLNCAWAFYLQAGGSGLNTVVVINQNSTNSRELANYFCERRQVPPENVLRIAWPGSNTSWTSNDFQVNLLGPLLDMLAARQLTNQIDYVVLSMDIPYQTLLGATPNSTTTALFYGLKSGGGTDLGVTNSYAGSEAVFRQAKPASAPGFSFLATMITADSLSQAEQLVDRGVASDRTQPAQAALLAKSSDPMRNIRYPYFDNAIFNVKVLGASTIRRTNSDSVWGQTGLLGYQTGKENVAVSSGTFVPGAIADSLTSFGGLIFETNNNQTTLLAFLNAGATGSYGTVAEPYTDAQKFPDPQVYFYQARGFNLAESYYQSINAPFLGLTVAEPLASPFARSAFGKWGTNLPNSILTGTNQLSVQFSAADASHPLQQIDLFVDGKFYSTLTNLGPSAGNVLTVVLNGFPITYTVPTNATLSTVSAGLGTMINNPATTNATRVKAWPHGDRVELQSMTANPLTVPFYVASTTPTNSSPVYRVSYLPDTFPPRMIPGGLDKSGVFQMDVEIPSTLPCVIQASTNLVDWVALTTNTEPGLLEFQDLEARNYPARFYRVAWPEPGQAPKLSAPRVAEGVFHMHMESVPGLPCAVLASSNLTDWTPVLTNQAGGGMDFVDPDATNAGARYYRAWLVPPAPPAFTVVNVAPGSAWVRIDSAARPYTVEVSTNQGPGITLLTNFGIGEIQVAASSAAGSGGLLSTFVRASRPRFLASEAFGLQKFTVIGSSPATDAWLQVSFTLTNGQSLVLGVTNLSGLNSSGLAAQLCTRINTNCALQGIDGVVAEDFVVDQAGTATFNLRARSPGYQAAAALVHLKRQGLVALPSSPHALNANLPDLQSRNHLYVSGGASSLAVNFPLDTTSLADGYHELTAVAYEGTHVRTQTPITLPVQVQNQPLAALLNPVDLPPTASVQGTYHIEVVANTTNLSAISLFSTGGLLSTSTVTNQAATTFTVNAASLGVGLHPFYALVETPSGQKYRTQTRWVRLIQ